MADSLKCYEVALVHAAPADDKRVECRVWRQNRAVDADLKLLNRAGCPCSWTTSASSYCSRCGIELDSNRGSIV